MRAAWWVAVGLLGCGDNLGAGDPYEPQSGSRLRLGWFTYDDGTRQLQQATFHDRELGTPCMPRRWSDGNVYCTPEAWSTTFADDACTVEVGASPGGPTPAAFFIRTYSLGATITPSRLHRRGARHPRLLQEWRLEGGECRGPITRSGFEYFELRPATAVRLRRSEPMGDSRLALIVHTSDDGVRAPAAIRDTVIEDDCVPTRVTGSAAPICVPTAAPRASHFRNDVCTERIVTIGPGEDQPITASLCEHSAGCTSFAHVAEEVSPYRVFAWSGDECVEVVLPLGSRAFAIGAALELAAMDRRIEPVAARRLDPIVLADGAMHVPDEALFDKTIGDECRLVEIAGVHRCVPGTDGPRFERYRLNSCAFPSSMIPLVIIDHACDAADVLIADERLAFFTLGAAYDGVFYERSTCGAIAVPPGYSVCRTGFAVPIEMFPIATLLVD
ncbi:MAG: hypothetical protein H0T89_02820 [Deltaproteobacteria bacterium]|nr:hypothetical protein [Deltaproteobacteria bacterium]MDQ3299351.1 hypothetical protein [Myxococcota bacterium]